MDIRGAVCETRLTLIEFARVLRKECTDAEALLWGCLRDRRVNGRKFRRQHPMKPYVLDFYCAQLRVAIELDGGQHYGEKGRLHDAVREGFLRKRGIRTLRFANREMLAETDAVMGLIWELTCEDVVSGIRRGKTDSLALGTGERAGVRGLGRKVGSAPKH